ncbi:MAG: leucine-rich repeat domain-containing protein [Clostridia bacterium]|nr:leucine-rich repeat domain-containing protein [Clostridia bacterium]
MKRVLAVILTLCLLLGAFPSFAEVDYASDYEAALKLAYNDLSNVQNVQEAIDMLKRLGSYMLSRGYVQYLGALADLAGEDPDMEKDILSISILAEAPTFVTDLEERGLPSCEELLQYMQARVLEQQADFAGAYDLYKTLMILDAPDRAIGLRMTINSTDSLVTVISRDENGSVLERRTEAISKGGEKTFTAKEFDGYELTPGSLRSVKVTVDSLGRQSHKEVVFVYRKLPDSATVSVVYRTDAGSTLETADVTISRGTAQTIHAKKFEGYELTTASSVTVRVDGKGRADKSRVEFIYRALPAFATVTVICRTDDGTQLSKETLQISRGTSKTVQAASFDGYKLTGASSVRVTVDTDGRADKSQVVFTYQRETGVNASAMKDFDWKNEGNDVVITKYKGDAAALDIPQGVTKIGENALKNCGSLVYVTIPKTVTAIGNAAFSSCKNLKNIAIPDSVTVIGSYAFSGCVGLTDITLSRNVTVIASNVFSGCTGLTSIELPGGVTTIEDHAFARCGNLKNVYLPSTLTGIGDSAFLSCRSLSDITIPNSVTYIGNSAFSDCRALTSVTIPNGVTSISNSLFSKCRNLTTVYLPDSVTAIGDSAFDGCERLINIVIPDSVKSIGSYAFLSCYCLKSITIPNGVTSIGAYAFCASGLRSITIPDSVKKMDYSVFRDAQHVIVTCSRGSYAESFCLKYGIKYEIK